MGNLIFLIKLGKILPAKHSFPSVKICLLVFNGVFVSITHASRLFCLIIMIDFNEVMIKIDPKMSPLKLRNYRKDIHFYHFGSFIFVFTIIFQ